MGTRLRVAAAHRIALKRLRRVQSTDGGPDAPRALGAAIAVRVFVQKQTVIVATGALATPALLQRSRVCGRGSVGRHLRLAPAALALGFFEPGAAPRTLGGGGGAAAPVATACMTIADADAHVANAGSATGSAAAAVATWHAPPAVAAALLPPGSGAQAARDVLQMRRMAAWAASGAEGGRGGRVALGPEVRSTESCSVCLCACLLACLLAWLLEVRAHGAILHLHPHAACSGECSSSV
jgi:hypothetical protein